MMTRFYVEYIELRDLLNVICVKGVGEGVLLKFAKEVVFTGFDRIYVETFSL